MGIGSYKEAERYRMRTNKNLTRTFYLDTRRTLDEEPFAWEQPQDASIDAAGRLCRDLLMEVELDLQKALKLKF
jgi:hypothetical protein